ncbi:hypothetical protein ACLB2K_064622 [Fragaria x ananassa]
MGSCLSAESRSPMASPSPASPGWGGASRRRKTSKKKSTSRSSSFDYRREDPALHRIPGRVFLNGSTQAASLFTQQGKKGTNQDAMIVWENFCSRTDTIFCGVFDGHGPYGHMVAKRVRDSLPLKLSSNWEVNINSEEVLKEISPNTAGSLNSDDAAIVPVDEDFRASIDSEESEKHPEIFHTLKESFLKAFRVMDRELRIQPSIDCFCSGTTAVTLVKQGRDIIVGNVGDSRAVLCTRDKDDTLLAVQLTVDLKPNLPAEAERIRKCRGRVFALHDEPEVCRVWLPNNDSPGLAMARAFGDFCLKDFGLISVPDVSYRRLTEKDEFIVLATDGIWDVLSNKEVVDIIASAPARSSAARALVESAVRAWRQKYPTSKVDDCAVVCLYLDSDGNNLSTAANNNLSEQHTGVDDLNAGSENEEDISGPTSFVRPGTVRNGEEILEDNEDVEEERSKENATMNSELGVDWSALEGVSRVNTLLTLPRFVPGKEDIKARNKGHQS